MAANETIRQLITRIAQEEGVDPLLALAIAQHESGLNPRAVGDGGHSIGLFQLHDAGEGAGMSVQERQDPEANARIAIHTIAQVQKARPELSNNPGALAVAAQRPDNTNNVYANAINGILKETTMAGSTQTVFPLAGGVAKHPITLAYGAPEPNPTGSGYVPDSHQGVDFAATTGDQILAPAGGVIIQAHQFSGDIRGDPAGSWVRELLPDGRTIIFQHLSAFPPGITGLSAGKTVSPRLAVQPGDVIGSVGSTGNATGASGVPGAADGAHLHFEVHASTAAAEQQGNRQTNGPSNDPMSFLQGATSGGLTMDTNNATPTPSQLTKDLTTARDAAQKVVDRDADLKDALTTPDIPQMIGGLGGFGKGPGAHPNPAYTAEAKEWADLKAEALAMKDKNGQSTLAGDSAVHQKALDLAKTTLDKSIKADQDAADKANRMGGQTSTDKYRTNADGSVATDADGNPLLNPNYRPTAAEDPSNATYRNAQAGAAKKPEQVAAESAAQVAQDQATTAKINQEIAQNGQTYAAQRAALVGQLSTAFQNNQIDKDGIDKRMAQFESLWVDDAARFKKTLDSAAALSLSTGIVHDPITGEQVMDPTTGKPQLTVARQHELQTEKVATETLAETERQRMATGAKNIADIGTARDTAFNAGLAQFESTGIATSGRIGGLNALRQPLPASQYATMLGLPENDPRVQSIVQAAGSVFSPGAPPSAGVPSVPVPAPNAEVAAPPPAAQAAAAIQPVQLDPNANVGGVPPLVQPSPAPVVPPAQAAPEEPPIQVPAAYYNQTATDLESAGQPGMAQNSYIDPATGLPVNVGDPYAIASGGGMPTNTLPWGVDPNAGRVVVPAAYGTPPLAADQAQGGGRSRRVPTAYPAAYARAA
jgi:murein DD-endopeptidase MepM/ murein hydrolase activator NlpD